MELQEIDVVIDKDGQAKMTAEANEVVQETSEKQWLGS